MNAPLLSRRQLQDALERLAHHLQRRGVHGELYLFGGGAMVLAYNAREATMDLDTAIRQHHGPVLAEARVVAEELGLPYWWLNEQATSYLPAGQDVEATVVLERPGLTVLAEYSGVSVHPVRSFRTPRSHLVSEGRRAADVLSPIHLLRWSVGLVTSVADVGGDWKDSSSSGWSSRS